MLLRKAHQYEIDFFLREVKCSSAFLTDLEREDSCASYLLEQIPHIFTFKDVRWAEIWTRKVVWYLACENSANVYWTWSRERIEWKFSISTSAKKLLWNSSNEYLRSNEHRSSRTKENHWGSFFLYRMLFNRYKMHQRLCGKIQFELVLSINKV